MKTLLRSDLIKMLRRLGLRRGDVVLCHSALHFLGRPAEGIGMYYAAMADVLSLPLQGEPSEGTLAVPTFNFAFARGECYDPQTTPSVGMGAFSEYVRRLPWAQRTQHPMQSLAVVGRYASDLASRDTLSAFDPGSAFERLLDLDAWLLLLGADVQACSIVHYSEQRFRVPYRYWKLFRGVIRNEKRLEERIYTMYVRDLSLNPQLKLHLVEDNLRKAGLWHSQPLNYGWLTTCKLRDFVAETDKLLQQDPWILIANRSDGE